MRLTCGEAVVVRTSAELRLFWAEAQRLSAARACRGDT